MNEPTAFGEAVANAGAAVGLARDGPRPLAALTAFAATTDCAGATDPSIDEGTALLTDRSYSRTVSITGTVVGKSMVVVANNIPNTRVTTVAGKLKLSTIM